MAVGAGAPEDDFGFIDREAVVMRRLQARGIAHRAVDVDGGVATTADQVVMVISHPSFVKRSPTGRFDPAEDPRGNEGVEIVVNRLSRKRFKSLPSGRHDEFRVLVLALVLNGFEDGQAGAGQAQIGLP